ncbi:hypothetical protein R1sor_018199 [Riccia sorocarpa]|uniref:Uncharacterized protein n=1 Tax=Riccia sorocarpa TaxID=122646 RepID=A0ABD3IBR5_9MARC
MRNEEQKPVKGLVLFFLGSSGLGLFFLLREFLLGKAASNLAVGRYQRRGRGDPLAEQVPSAWVVAIPLPSKRVADQLGSCRYMKMSSVSSSHTPYTQPPDQDKLQLMDPRSIFFSVSQIPFTLSRHKNLPILTLTEALQKLRRRDMKVKDFPRMSVVVVTCGEEGWYYSKDNRILWIFRELDEKVEVFVVEATEDF